MASACYYLTVAEKDALLAENPTYSLVSGPHETEAECEAVCADTTGTGTGIIPDPGIVTGCCEDVSLPFNITFTFAMVGCEVSLPAQWNSAESRYECDVSSIGCGDSPLYLVCQEGAWYLAGVGNATAISFSCDPLAIEFSFGSLCDCGGGTVVVTE